MGIGKRSFWIDVGVALTSAVLLFGVGEGYKNYTVGDSLGWYDTLFKPSADYQAWADDKSFSLGDFLIFNTDNNHSVVQTYNVSSYKSCDYTGEDSIEWSTSRPSNTEVYPVTVAVPLLKEGVTYFFSGDYDGWQCQHGQQFTLNVTHGQGLPPSLKATPESASAPSPSDAEDSIPDSAMPDFSHPKNPQSPQSGSGSDDDGGSEDSKAEASGGGAVFGGGPGFGWALLFVLMALCWCV